MAVKVCHVTSVHQRYDTRVFYKECTSLANAGYDVTLLVADNKEPETRNGVKIISADFKPKSRWERIFNASRVMFDYAMTINAEIYHLHDPELLPVGKKLKSEGKKVIFDSHEDVPAQILNKAWIPSILRKPCSVAYLFYANSILKKMNYVIGVTPHLVDKLRRVNSNVEMISNFPILESHDAEQLLQQDKTDNMRRSIVFAGGITKQWSHEEILQAIEGLDILYKLAGPSSREYIEKLEQYPSWANVDYRGKIPHEKVKELFQESAVGLAVLQYSPNSDGANGTLGNTKLFEYMMAGLPVICTDFKLWKDIINKWHCGICVNPKDVNAIRQAINYLIHNSEEASNMGENGRKAVVEEFNWSIEEKILLGLYKKLI